MFVSRPQPRPADPVLDEPDLAGSVAGLAGAMTVGSGALLTWLTGAVLTLEHAAAQLTASCWLSRQGVDGLMAKLEELAGPVEAPLAIPN